MPRERLFERVQSTDKARDERLRSPVIQAPRLVEREDPRPPPPKVERSPFGHWLKGGRS